MREEDLKQRVEVRLGAISVVIMECCSLLQVGLGNGSNSKTHSLFLIPSQFLGPNQRMMKARSFNSQAVSKISKDNGV